MPRLRSKILPNSESKNDSSIEIFTPDKNKRKSRKQSGLFSISKLNSDEQMLNDESIEFVSLISPDIKTTESEEEISTKNISKRNKTKYSDIEETKFQNSDSESNVRQLRSRKSISKANTIENSDTSRKKRSIVSKKSNDKNLDSSNSDIENSENNHNILKKTRKVKKSSNKANETKNSNNIENEDTEKSLEKVVPENKLKSKMGKRKPNKNSEVMKQVENNYVDSNSDTDKKLTRNHEKRLETVQITDDETPQPENNVQEVSKLNKFKRYTRTNEDVENFENTILKSDQEINIGMNLDKLKIRRKSGRIGESSVSAVEDLITDDEDRKIVEETKLVNSKRNRRSARAHENSYKAVETLTTEIEEPRSEDQKIDLELNQIKSKVNRKSTRAHENSYEAVETLTTKIEDCSSEDQKNDLELNRTNSKVNRKSTRTHENSFEAAKDLIICSGENRRLIKIDENSFMAIKNLETGKNSENQKIDREMNQSRSKKDRRSARIHESSFEAVKDLITDSEDLKSEGSDVSMNRSKSRTDRRSTRIHESSFEIVNDLITDNEHLKSEEIDVNISRSKSRTDRRSARIHENSFGAVKDLINENKDTTFSPKSPKFQYQDTFTPTINGRTMRKSKYETSTPAKSLLSKSITQKVNLNQTPANMSLIDLTNFTPRSIIKKSTRTVQNSTKSLEKNDMKITLRKKRSISESDLTSARKSRVTFHPNTSVFHMDSLDSTLDDSEISLNAHSTSLIKESTSKKSVDFVSINPLNDTYDMEAFENQSADAIEGAHLSIKSNEEIDGVCKLNETFTPEEDKSKIREISKRIKIHDKQPLVIDSSAKKKVFKKTPKRLIHSNVGGGSKKSNHEEKTPAKAGTNNLQRNIKAAIGNNVISKNDIVNSSKKTPSTSNKNQQPTPKRGTSVKKMPDFASIHKRNFEKMESLVENVKKRADRAKQLFSIEAGNKDISTNNQNKPTRLPVAINRLVASTTTAKTPSKENTPGKANLPNTPGKAIIKNTPGKPTNRFGFGFQNAKDKKELLKEEIKKKQTIRGDLGTLRQKDRQYIKGVRSNRRFDLLMQSRDCK